MPTGLTKRNADSEKATKPNRSIKKNTTQLAAAAAASAFAFKQAMGLINAFQMG